MRLTISCAERRVRAHHRPLGLVQLLGLRQDRLRDRDLADVVQPARQARAQHGVLVEPETGGDRRRQLGDLAVVVLRHALAAGRRLGERLRDAHRVGLGAHGLRRLLAGQHGGVAAALVGRRQGVVGGGEQLERVVRVAGARGADRHGRPQLAAADQHRPAADDLADRVGDAEQRLVVRDVRRQHREALVVEAAERVVRAQHRLQARRDLDQHRVARGRAVLARSASGSRRRRRAAPPGVASPRSARFSSTFRSSIRWPRLYVSVRASTCDLRSASARAATASALASLSSRERVAQLVRPLRHQVLGERQPARRLLGHQRPAARPRAGPASSTTHGSAWPLGRRGRLDGDAPRPAAGVERARDAAVRRRGGGEHHAAAVGDPDAQVVGAAQGLAAPAGRRAGCRWRRRSARRRARRGDASGAPRWKAGSSTSTAPLRRAR